ncbi:MAG: O-antigen ligase family protein [Firmicutes bacterium]|nr:O-antigen ligase family protein [Bacillota bacterium]
MSSYEHEIMLKGVKYIMKLNTLLKNKIFISLLILGLFEPDYISWMGGNAGGMWYLLHLLFRLLLWFDVAAIFVLFLITKKVKLSWCTVSVIVFWAVCLFSDIYNGAGYSSDLKVGIEACALILLVEIYFKKDIAYNLLQVIAFWLGSFIVINFLTILFTSDGLYINSRGWRWNYFLGYKNLHVYIFLPYLMSQACIDFLKNGKLSKIFYGMTAVILVSSVMNESSTAFASCSIVVALLIFFKRKNVPTLNAVSGFAVSIVLSVAIIGFSFQNTLSGFIQAVFQKDTTFTGRLTIWSASLIQIRQHPILGNGNAEVNAGLSWDVTQCHNRYLDVLFVGGIVLLGVFVWMLWLGCSRLLKHHGEFANILSFILIGYAVVFLMEGRRVDILFYYTLLLTSHIDYFQNRIKSLPQVENKCHRKRIRVKIR